jgi:DNA-binding CsgD family transcriptional regulator
MILGSTIPSSPMPEAPSTLAAVVNALGTDAFESETLKFVHQTVGAEHYCVYRLRAGEAQFLGGASMHGRHAMRDARPRRGWRQRSYADLRAARMITQERDGTVLFHEELSGFEDPGLDSALAHFHIVDRVMLCGRATDDLYAVSLLRSETAGQFAALDLERLAGSADILLAVCAKHAAIRWDATRGVAHFDSVDTIEANLRVAKWGLSERELQVSARILYGISAVGIAIDLGLGEETIATYRKRLYARLRIGGRHELFQKYLSLL